MLLLWIVVTPLLCSVCFIVGAAMRSGKAEEDCIKCFKADAYRHVQDMQASNEQPYVKGWQK